MRKCLYRKLVLPLSLSAVLLASGCGDDDSESPATHPVPLTSAMVLQPGSAGVGVTTMVFTDTSRPTMANGSYRGAPSRVLTTEIWYPTVADPAGTEQEHRDAPLASNGLPYPLIIYSHGFLSNRQGGAYIARHLATYGYIVAAPDFPLTSSAAPGGPTLADVVNQPGDVSFLIDQVLNLNGTTASGLSGTAIDRQRIGLTGLSLGGMTTYLAAFHPTLRDSRVRAAAPLAGPACFFGPAFFAARALPLMIVHGSLDAIVPYQQNGVFAFQEAGPPKYLITLLKGTHTAFADFGTSTFFDNLKNPDTLGCGGLGSALARSGPQNLSAQLGGAADGIITGDCPLPCTDPTPRPTAMKASRQHELTLLSVLPFFEATLRNDARARQFLLAALASENPDLEVQSTPSP